MSETCQLAVIGAGPAGLEAAIAAAEAGVDTILIDSALRAGGQYYKPLPAAFRPLRQTGTEKEGESLVARLERSGAKRIYDALTWGLFTEEDGNGYRLCLSVAGSPRQIHADRLVLAGGAYDTPLAFPGWTLPGVLTCGAALNLLKNQRVAPFKRVLVSGTGPLSLSVAAHLVAAGVEVACLCEANHIPLSAAGYGPQMLGHGHRITEGIQYVSTLIGGGTRVRMGWSVVEARGKERVDQAVIAKLDNSGAPIPGSEQVLAVDAVICGFGLTPNNGMARMLGCQFAVDPANGEWVPRRDGRMQTSLPGVYMAGDCVQINGAENARLEGRLAGTAAALDCQRISPAQADHTFAQIQPALSRQQRYGRMLAKLFPLKAGLRTLAHDETYVCRCEEVTQGMVKAAIAAGATTIGEVKMVTRVGMGNCQGRICEQTIARIIAQELSSDPASAGMYTIRPPLHPLPIGFFAKDEQEI